MFTKEDREEVSKPDTHFPGEDEIPKEIRIALEQEIRAWKAPES